MIGPDDIAAFADDFETVDKVLDRYREGVPMGREIMANEMLPFLRAVYLMRETLAESGEFMLALYNQQLQSMDVANPGENSPER